MVTKIRTPKLKSGKNRSFTPLNHIISDILGQRNAWFEVAALFVYRKHTLTNLKTFKPWRESLLNGCKTSNVWLPSMSCLHPIRTCFSITCPRLDENDGIDEHPIGLEPYMYHSLGSLPSKKCCSSLIETERHVTLFLKTDFHKASS